MLQICKPSATGTNHATEFCPPVRQVEGMQYAEQHEDRPELVEQESDQVDELSDENERVQDEVRRAQ